MMQLSKIAFLSFVVCFTTTVLGNVPKIIYREEWGGNPPVYTTALVPPVEYVIVSHSAGSFLTTPSDCAATIRDLQNLHVSQNGSPDIGYNFLICGDGNVYVGRDWNTTNFHMDNSIGICFLGNYMLDELTNPMIEAALFLLQFGSESEVLTKEYKVVGHNQTFITISPGENVYKVIKEWLHFYPGQVNPE